MWTALHLNPDPTTKTVTMHMFVDRSSIEVFGNNGEKAITDLIFPDPSSLGLQLYATGGDVKVNSLHLYKMNKSWVTTPFVSNISGWNMINGMWTDTRDGKQGRSTGDSFILSSQIGADFTYEGDVTVKNGNGNYGAGALVLRSDADASNAYIANVDVKSQLVKLWKKVNGTSSVIATYPMSLQKDTSYHLKVTTAGNNIQVRVNDALVINATDTSFGSGYFGLNVWDTTAVIQNVSASNDRGLLTNMKGMKSVNGSWSDTTTGKQGSSVDDAFMLSTDKGFDSIYEGDITVDSGAGALVFRSDADASNAYIANVDVQNQLIKLWKKVNGVASVIATYPTTLQPHTSYHVKVETNDQDIKVYVNDTLAIHATDNSFSSGYFGLNVWNGTSTFQNVIQKPNQTSMTNPNFETGDLTGWNVISGTAFTNKSVTSDTNYWPGNDTGMFGQNGIYHLWGFKASGDEATGVLTSNNFILGGDGQITFLIGGGQNSNNLYVALVRKSDGAELFKATGQNNETYSKVSWDASAYIGTQLFIKIVDNSAAGWGHINIDNLNAPVRPSP